MPTVVWKFEGDAADLEKALANVRGEAQGTESALDSTGKTGSAGLKKVAAVAGGVLVAGIAAATAAAVGLAVKVVKVAGELDNLAKQAKRAGATASELDQIRGVFDLAGVSIGQTDTMVKKFRVNLGKAATGTAAQADALALLGTKAEDFVGLPLDRKLALVARGMKGIEDPAIRATVATDLFGRSGLDILPLLEDGEEAWAASAAAIDKAGVASNEHAEQSEALVDAIALMNRTGGTMLREFLAPMIPALTNAATAVTETLQAFDTSRLVEWSGALADVIDGAIIAARAVGLLREAEDEEFKRARDAARAEIAQQAEKTSALKDAFDRRGAMIAAEEQRLGILQRAQEDTSEATDGLTLAMQQFQRGQLAGDRGIEGTTDRISELRGEQEQLRVEWEQSRETFKRLSDELSGEAGLTTPRTRPDGGDGAPPAGRPGAKDDPAAAPEPVSLDSAALDAHAEAWDGVRAAIEAVERATGKVLDRQLSASDKVIKAKEAEEAAIVALVNEAVSNTLLSEDQKSAIIADGNAARLALAEQLAADLERIRQEDLAAEEAAAEGRLSLWKSFQEAWADGLGQIVNAAGALAVDIVDTFAGMAGDVMDERIAAHQETGREIERINAELNDTVDEQERERLEGAKARLQERSAAEKEAALEAFERQKALALLSASINTALAVINALATAPTIVAGIVLAALAGVAGGVAIATIASQKPPSFHAGGVLRASDVAGSSMDSVSVRAKPGEGFLTTSGVAAAGGPDGVDALNAGRSGGGGTSINVFRFGTRTTEAISHQQLRSRTGNMQTALRGVRPKVGRSIPGRR